MRTWLAVVAIALVSCGEKPHAETYLNFPDQTWGADEPVELEFDVQDTTGRYNFMFTFRHGQAYRYSNLYIFTKLHFPNGKTLTDTLECYLADASGRWLGKGIGDLVDHRILLMEQAAAFPLKGKYKLTITQAMRDDELMDVYDAGFSLEKASQD
jgi:gliding motility-associated lipoprotein GldH